MKRLLACTVALLLGGWASPVEASLNSVDLWDSAVKLLNLQYVDTNHRPQFENQNATFYLNTLNIQGDLNWNGGLSLGSPTLPSVLKGIGILFVDHLEIKKNTRIVLPPEFIMIFARSVIFDQGATATISGGVPAVCTSNLKIDGQTVSPNAKDEHGNPAYGVSGRWTIATVPPVNSANFSADDLKNLSQEFRSGSMSGSNRGCLQSLPFVNSKEVNPVDVLNSGFIRTYESLLSDLNSADMASKRGKVLKFLAIEQDILRPNSDFPFLNELNKLKSQILTVRDKYVRTVFQKLITVQPESIPQQVRLFASGDSGVYQAEPNLAVVDRYDPQTSTLGAVTLDPESAQQLRLYLSVDLQLDDWVSSLVEENLARDDGNLNGVFTDWDFEPRQLPTGVLNAKAEMTGTKLNLTLTLDRPFAEAFLWSLMSDAGAPFVFNWIARLDPTVHGTLPLRISLRNSAYSDFTVTGSQITNHGVRNLDINYVKWGSIFQALQPALVLKPGDTITLPRPGGSTGNLEVPGSGVAWEMGPSTDLTSLLSIVNSDQLVQTVTVRDRLSNFNIGLKENLKRIDLSLNFISQDGNGNRNIIEGGSLSLAPSGAIGDSAHLTFISPRTGAISVDVKGTAIFENSSKILKERVFDTLVVNLSDEMLP